MKRTIFSIVALLCMTFAMAQQKSHTIQRGETIESIAKKYNVSVYALEQANPDIKDMFYVGMKLAIPDEGKVSASDESDKNSDVGMGVSSEYNWESNTSSADEGNANWGNWDMTGRIAYTSIMEIPSKGKTLSMDGLRVSMDIVYAFTPNWFVSAGLGSIMGYKKKDGIENDYFSLMLPVNIGYKLPVTEKIGLTLRAGPYADYVFERKQKYGKMETKFTKTKGYNKAIFGINASATINYDRYGIFFEYDLGLSEREKKMNENYWSVGISAGF